MAQHEYQQHWQEGTKYALEGMKTLFILNGASAVSILTFAGNTKHQSSQLVCALVVFGFGALFGFLSMLGAYLTELHYGNAKRVDIMASAHGHYQRKAHWFHCATYVFLLLGIICFVIGTIQVASGLWPTS